MVIVEVGLGLFLTQPPTAAYAQQPPRQAAGAQSAALTPAEREAQKHYRIALEALKNNDLDIALQELNTAAEMAPKNALIWYNIAVVESKRGDGNSGLEHLQKANTLGLPRALRRDADDLEAKLSYAAEKGAKKKAFLDKLAELQNEINGVAVLRSGDCAPNRNSSSPNTTISCR